MFEQRETRTVVGEVGSAYRGCRERVVELVGPLDEQMASVPVPTCPSWSVHDVVAHLTGVVDDAMAGRLDGVGTDGWTAAQVDARRGSSVADLVGEWEAKAPAFEEVLDSIGGHQAVFDAVTHEHDIRTALHEPGSRDSDAVQIGLGFVVQAFVETLPPGVSLRVRTTDGTELGDPDGRVVLTGDAFEILRAMTGRRSEAQLREMTWEGDSDAILSNFTFGPFHPATDRIDE